MPGTSRTHPLSRHPNLPVPPTPLIGREREIDTACEVLRRDEVRLLTLIGPPGVGKTRLGLQVAADLASDFAGEVYLVLLAPVRDPSLVLSAIAHALHVTETGSQPLLATLKDYMAERQLLLFLDNFEQVVEAAPVLGDLLSTCPGLKVLITSREVLRLYGEHEFAVPPLSVPEASGDLTEAGHRSEALSLFEARARAARPSFRITQENAATIAEICRRLDGLPLAIELAAARINVLTPRALANRLQHRLQLLTSGPHDLPQRQQTLRGAIEWSYTLLTPEEQRLFRLLSVFRAGCTLEAVSAVEEQITDQRPEDSAQIGHDVLDGIASLINKSLLRQEEAKGGEPRYYMLETIQEYGQSLLERLEEAHDVHRGHALYFLALAEEAEAEMRGPRQGEWVARLAVEHDNLRAALDWSRAAPEGVKIALRLAKSLAPFWRVYGYLGEGRQILASILAHPDGIALERDHADLWGDALYEMGALDFARGDYVSAQHYGEKSLLSRQQLGTSEGIARSLILLGAIFANQGSPGAARVLLEEGLSYLQGSNDRAGIAEALIYLGHVSGREGDYAQARLRYERSLALYREIGNKQGVANALFCVGHMTAVAGDHRTAKPLLSESLALYREMGYKQGIADALHGLGHSAIAEADQQEARDYFRDANTLFQELGHKLGTAHMLYCQGFLALNHGEYGEAEKRLGECYLLYRQTGDKREIGHALLMRGYISSLQGHQEAARRLMEQGQALLDEIGDRRGIAHAVTWLGGVAHYTGSNDEARRLVEEGMRVFKELRFNWFAADASLILGNVAVALGDLESAEAHYRGSLRLRNDLAIPLGVAECLEGLAALRLARGDPQGAGRLLGAAEMLRTDIGTPVAPVDKSRYMGLVDAVRAQLGDSLYAAAWEEGSALTPEQATAYALGGAWGEGPKKKQRAKPGPGKGEQARPTPTTSPDREMLTRGPVAHLTPRELDVLHLVARGLTNAQVAQQLVLSPNTVSIHLYSIYGKLGVKSRTAAARFAMEQGLA